MNGTITYLNTDLDLTSPTDLSALERAFTTRGLFSLHVTQGENGNWFATFETLDQHSEPEHGIATMLKAVESLTPRQRSIWDCCTQREFNIGYDCGDEPWAFSQGLSCELLRRIADFGASLRWTLYPNREEKPPPPAC